VLSLPRAEMNDEWAEVRRYMTFEPVTAVAKPESVEVPTSKKEVRKQLPVFT
jgi:hypothetical protein